MYAHAADGEIRQGDDSDEVKWFPLDDLPEKLAFDHRQNIDDTIRCLHIH